MMYYLGTSVEPNVLHLFLGAFSTIEERESAKEEYTQSGGEEDFLEWEAEPDQYNR